MPYGSSSAREQCHVVLADIQGLVSCAGLQSLDNGLDVLRLAVCGFCDRITLLELHLVMTNEWAGAESRAADVRHLEQPVDAAEQDSESLGSQLGHVEDTTAERAL